MKRDAVRVVVFCLVMFMAGAVAHAKTFHLTSTKVTPAATATVDVDTDKNGNIEVDIKVEHLALPGALAPPATAYVVWFRQQGSTPQKEGQLRVNSDLKGELKTTTPFHDFDIFVTAESDPEVKTPSATVVLRGRIEG